MAKNSIQAYGAEGKTNVLTFDPDKLTLVTDPNHALYDERVHLPLSESMVLNVMAIGVHTAISIVKDSETGETLVVAGRQRVKHAREANRRLREQGRPIVLVPALVKRGDLDALLISENEQRQADTPLGRAKKMVRYLDRGRDEDWLALHFGCSKQTVRQTIALLDAPAAVRTAVEAGQITATAAHKLAKLPAAEQRAKVAELVKAGEGAKGHAKARAQRAALGVDAPKVRGRREIAKARDAAAVHEVRAALSWVLGERETVA